jgi:hypothetical protein
MSNKIYYLLIIGIIYSFSSCKEEDEYNDVVYVEAETVSADVNENVLLVHNSKLSSSNGDEGMEYDSETGDINISLSSAEDAEYNFTDSLIISVDLDTTAILRQITSIDTLNEVIYLKTTDVDLEEIFRDADFTLTSEIDEDVELTSTSSIEEINKALSDGAEIHPARVIYYTNEGIYAQSVFSDESIEGVQMLNNNLKSSINLSFSQDFTGYEIFNYSSDDGNVSKEAKLYVSEGNMELGVEFKMYTKIKWFKLKKFYFSVNPYATTDIKLALDANASYSTEGEKKLASNVVKKTFIYYVGACVLAVTVDVDIYGGYEFSTEASIFIEAGTNAEISAEFGAQYKSDDGWSDINNFTCDLGSTIDYSGKVDANLKASIYPKIGAKICGVDGISLSIKPYVYADFTTGDVLDVLPDIWKYIDIELGTGLDAEIDAEVKIVKKTLASYNEDFEIIEPYIIWGSYSEYQE